MLKLTILALLFARNITLPFRVNADHPEQIPAYGCQNGTDLYRKHFIYDGLRPGLGEKLVVKWDKVKAATVSAIDDKSGNYRCVTKGFDASKVIK